MPNFSLRVLDSKRQHFSKFSADILTNWKMCNLIIECSEVCICSRRVLTFRFMKSPRNLCLSKTVFEKECWNARELLYSSHIRGSESPVRWGGGMLFPYSCVEEGVGIGGTSRRATPLRTVRTSPRTQGLDFCARALFTTSVRLSLGYT